MSSSENRKRFFIALVGHIDHGKSTLLGRLIYELNQLPADRYDKTRMLSNKYSKKFEYAFLLDALEEEQKSGITIEGSKALCHFPECEVCFFDAPGHHEFLKSMISGSAQAHAAILVVDSQAGISEQTRRHAAILGFLGIKHVIVALSKMDLVAYSQAKYQDLKQECSKLLLSQNLTPQAFVPISALQGEGICHQSQKLRTWYQGKTLQETLEILLKQILPKNVKIPLRFCVQDFYPHPEQKSQKLVIGRVESGKLHVGDSLIFFPSRKKIQVISIHRWKSKKDPDFAETGESIGVLFKTKELPTLGEIACDSNTAGLKVSKKIQAKVLWFGKSALQVHDSCEFTLVTQQTQACVQEIKEIQELATLTQKTKNILYPYHIAKVILKLQNPLACDIFANGVATGRFALFQNSELCAAGFIETPL